MNCPLCDSKTKITDTRYFPEDAEVRTTRSRVEGERRIDEPRARWLDIPRRDRDLMEPGSHWRRHKCLVCDHSFATAETILAPEPVCNK